MLAKLTGKNHLILPNELAAVFEGAEYFDVTEENGRILLTPVTRTRADAVREKLDRIGITEDDIADAVAWARRE